MKYIKNFSQINESKQVGILYHVTSLESFHEIVRKNFVFKSAFGGSNNFPSISFTRKSKGDFMPTPGRMVRFTFDGDKMSEKYKLEPYADHKRGYGRKSFSSQKDEAETILVTQKEGNYGKRIDLKPYIIRIDIIYHSMFNRDFDEEREFLEKIDLPIFIHKNTWDSVHEVPIIQKHKSNFQNLKDIPAKDFILPEAQALYKSLLSSLQNDYSYSESEYIDGLYGKNILHSRNIEYALKFKNIEDMANQLSVYPEIFKKREGRLQCDYAAKKYGNEYVAYKL